MAITNGDNLNTVLPANAQVLSTNYLDLAGTADEGWAQQYLPDLMEKEAEVFGPRTISGFLSQVGAEEAMQGDQVVWSEQGRLHISYTGKVSSVSGGGVTSAGEIEIENDIDGNDIGTDHAIRTNDTVILASATGVCKAIVSEAVVGSAVIEVAPYGLADLTAAGITQTAADSVTILVYGSEYGKGQSYQDAAGTGTTDQRGANEPSFKSFSNKPIILKDYYEVSGSDTARVGWVEITSETGGSGYAWYLKAESDTRARFNDYLEMAMLEGEIDRLDASANLVEDALYGADGTKSVGTEGLFAAIEARGNMTSGVTGVNAATDLAEFDAILAEFDKQGAIEET